MSKKSQSSEPRIGKPAVIVMKKVHDLVPYLKNARTHDEHQVALIANSIREFGFNNPCLLDGANGVIAGHGRLQAARILKLDEIPCIELAHLSPTQKRAYIIADNQIALKGGWQNDMLKSELDFLKEDDFDLRLIGFDADEIKALMDSVEKTVEGVNPDDTISFGIFVDCKNEKEQQKIFRELNDKGITCKLMN